MTELKVLTHGCLLFSSCNFTLDTPGLNIKKMSVNNDAHFRGILIEFFLLVLGVTFRFFSVAILCSCAEFFFDAEKLVVFSHTVRT